MPFELKDIKTIRKNLGLTQSELAKKCNVSQSLITKIESNLIDPSYSKAKKIFDTLSNLTKESKLKANDIMNKRVIFANPDETIHEVIKKMKKYEISQLPVFDKCITGLISETIILNNIDKINSKVKDIMNGAPPVISKESSIDVVSSLLKYFPMVLVIDNGKIEGVITKADVLVKLG